MEVPFVDLKAQYRSISDEIGEAMKRVIDDTAFIGGKYAESFERHFADYVGVRRCVGVGNGTDALFIALKALGVGEGDEVITAANTFIATSEAITMAGARVVFVDCDEKTYNIDVKRLEDAITDKTKAVIPVHLYGQPADMDELLEIVKRHGLIVIEDAAQAHGARYRGRNVGSLGDCACFSFYPGKNLGAYGDAGAIMTDDAEVAERARIFANHGRKSKYDHGFEGVNSRLDGFQGAILDVKLLHLDKWIERRRTIAGMYDEGLKDVVITPVARPDVRHVYHLYVIRVKNRDKLMGFLKEKGISTGIHYPIPLPFLEAYRYLKHSPLDFPVAYSQKDELLSIPIHGDLTDEQVAYVVDQLREGLSKV